jgi:hypothetical protein
MVHHSLRFGTAHSTGLRSDTKKRQWPAAVNMSLPKTTITYWIAAVKQKAISTQVSVRSGRGGAEGLGAVRAGTNTAEMIVAEDAGRVTVSKRDLNSVIADRGGRLRAGLRFKHR